MARQRKLFVTMKPNAIRQVFFRMLSQGQSVQLIARSLGVSRTILYKWKKAGPQQQLRQTRPNARRRKLDAVMTQALKKHFRDHNTITLRQASHWLLERFSVTVSMMTVSNYCRRLNLTIKKACKAYTEMNEERAQQWLQDIAVDFGPHVIALDEAAFFYNHVRGYAWSTKGSRAIVKRPGQRGKAH